MAGYTPTANDIEFTQFLMPNGRQDTVWIDRPDEIVARAKQIRAAGYEFHCEMLGDHKTISLTISNDEGDHAAEVVANGPEVPEAIDRMILGFNFHAATEENTALTALAEDRP